jgi:hypothetical protein
VVSVAAGQRHTLVLSKEGNVYSFGDGTVGQLGHGNNLHTGLAGLTSPTRIEAFKLFSPTGYGCVCVYVLVCVCVCVCVYMYICCVLNNPPIPSSPCGQRMYACMYVCMYVYIYVCVCVCVICIYRGNSTSLQQQCVNKMPVSFIAAGAYSSAAVTVDGMVWLWGRGA